MNKGSPIANCECSGTGLRHRSSIAHHLALALLAALLAILPACSKKPVRSEDRPLTRAYDTEQDLNDPQRVIPLGYQQAQGKRIFYSDCVWCHADSTPAGPSNRSNLTPTPALINDGKIYNSLTDEYLQNIIALGGSAVGKSAMMPPWGETLSKDEIKAVIAYIRAVAQPPYRPPVQAASQYLVR